MTKQLVDRMFDIYDLETIWEQHDREWLRVRRKTTGTIVAFIPWITDRTDKWNLKRAAKLLHRTHRL